MEVVCAAIDPIVQLVQNFLDITFTFLALFGVSAPDVRTLAASLTGCTFS